MTGCFLDSTVLIHISEGKQPEAGRGEAFVRTHLPAEVPDYAIRETLAGKLSYLCDAYNTLLAAKHQGEALIAFVNRPSVSGRRREVPLKIFSEQINAIFGAGLGGSPEEHKREALQALALTIQTLWNGARAPPNVARTNPLACLNAGELERGEGGEFRGPGNVFACRGSEKYCDAAHHLHDDDVALTAMLNALEAGKPAKRKKGDPAPKEKNETTRRRSALKTLKDQGPKGFKKGSCRAIGDAYFAAMCPIGSVLATTNLSDFEPLCKALGKRLERP